MMQKAYSLLDIKTGVYSLPFFFLHQAFAVRAVCDMVTNADNQVARYPFDFRLVRLGEFDDNVGLLLSTTHDDIGTVGALLQQYLPASVKDPSEMTSSEVVELRNASRS